MGDNFGGFDVSDYGVPKGDGETETDIELLSVSTDRVVRADQKRTERAIVGAIRAGYDGVDINQPLSELFARGVYNDGVRSIEPWSYPAPDGANGFRTERYTWDWFSDDELTALLRADDPLSALERGHE